MSLQIRSPRKQLAAQALSLQCASLQCPGNTPRGVYVSTDEQDPLVLHGVVFPPSSGPFSGGVFRFVIRWGPASFSNSSKTDGSSSSSSSSSSRHKSSASNAPTVTFNQGLNHPLIHPSTHSLSLAPRFPSWRPRSDTLSHLLYYIRDCFGSKLLEDVKPREGWWTNAEMGRLLRTSTKMFSNLASQSVQLSLSSSVLYPVEEDDKDQMAPAAVSNRGIRFTRGGKELDIELSALRRDIFGDDGRENAD